MTSIIETIRYLQKKVWEGIVSADVARVTLRASVGDARDRAYVRHMRLLDDLFAANDKLKDAWELYKLQLPSNMGTVSPRILDPATLQLP